MVERELKAYILTLARIMARETGLKLTTVSRRIHGTDVFMRDFKTGKRTVTLSQLERMLKKFREQWPKGVRFPAPPRLSTPGKKKRKSWRDSPTTAQPEGNGVTSNAPEDDSGNPAGRPDDELRRAG